MEVTQERQGYEGSLSELIVTVRDTVQRRWKIMTAITAAIVLLGFGLIMTMTPKYEAVARIQIDPSRNPLAKSGSQQSDTLSPEAIETEVSIINSRDLAQKVVAKLNLQNDPELTKGFADNPALRPGTPAFDSALINSLQNRVSAGREKLSYIIAISVQSVDADKAALIANTYADLYLDTKVSSIAGSAQNQVEWYRKRLDTLQAEVRDADNQVAQYRAAAGIVGGRSADGGSTGTIADERVGPLSVQIATAESNAASAQARLAAAQQQAARGGLDSVSEVRSSSVVAELRRQRAELLRTIGEIQARYGDKHPESLRVRGLLETVDRQINEEGERVLGSLRADAAAAQAQVNSLRGSMGSLETERARDMRAAVQADSLEREAVAKRAEYDRLSQMLLERTQAAQNSIAQAEVVGRAQAPLHPSSPNKPMLLALSLLVGLTAGAGTIFVQEMMSAGIRSSSEIEEYLDLPLLAAVPRITRNKRPADLLLTEPTSIFSESFRIARASILGLKSDKPIKVIAISSALPSEGKTTTALSIARTFAISGDRTLLVECDVRRAAMSEALDIPAGQRPGIVEYLHKEATVDQVIQSSAVANLDQILVSSPYFSSEDLFSGAEMRQLLEQMKDRYDRIILDLPPLVGLADGRFLSAMADTLLLAIKWDGTPRKAAETALQSLRMDGTNVAGAMLTMVDTRAEAMGSLYYSKKYSGYYQSK